MVSVIQIHKNAKGKELSRTLKRFTNENWERIQKQRNSMVEYILQDPGKVAVTESVINEPTETASFRLKKQEEAEAAVASDKAKEEELAAIAKQEEEAKQKESEDAELLAKEKAENEANEAKLQEQRLANEDAGFGPYTDEEIAIKEQEAVKADLEAKEEIKHLRKEAKHLGINVNNFMDKDTLIAKIAEAKAKK